MGVSVGVSLDGDVRANRLRIDHQGLGTWDRTVAGIHNLKRAGCFSGIQSVIDLDSDPECVLAALAEFQPPEIELGQPFGSHDNLPDVVGRKYTVVRVVVCPSIRFGVSPRNFQVQG